MMDCPGGIFHRDDPDVRFFGKLQPVVPELAAGKSQGKIVSIGTIDCIRPWRTDKWRFRVYTGENGGIGERVIM